MGFTRKTWLALALAIVLVLGLSATAFAAAPSNTSLSPSGITTPMGTGDTATVEVTITAADASSTITLDSSSDAVTVASPIKTISSEVTTSTKYTWTVTAATAGSATLTATYKKDNTTVTSATPLSVTVNPKSIAIKETSPIKVTWDAFSNPVAKVTVIDGTSKKEVPSTMLTLSSDVTSLFDAATYAGGQWGFKAKDDQFGKAKLTASLTGSGTVKADIDAYVYPSSILIDETLFKDLGVAYTGSAAGEFNLNIYGTGKNKTKLDKKTAAALGLTITQTTADIVTITEPGSDTGTDWVVKANKVGTTKLTIKAGDLTVTSKDIKVIDPTKVSEMKAEVVKGELPQTVGFTVIPADGDGKDSYSGKFVDGANIYALKLTIGPATATADDTKLSLTSSSTNMVVSQPKYVSTDKYVTGHINQGQPVATADVGKPKWPFHYNIEIKKAGTYSLTIKATDGGNYSRKITFKFENAKASGLNAIADMTIRKDQRVVIKATPTDTTPVRTSFTYKSSNKKAATIDSKGILRGIGIGKTTTITVKDTISGKSVSFKVTVQQDYSKITYRALAMYNTDTKEQVRNLVDPLFESATFNGEVAQPGVNSWGINLNDANFNTAGSLLTALKGKLADVDKEDAVSGYKAFKDEDVTMIYFNGKVDANGDIVHGAATDATNTQVMKIDDLANELAAHKGTFVIVFDCDLANNTVAAKGMGTTASVTKSIVSAFAKQSAMSSKTIRSATAGGDFARFRMLVSTSKSTQKANSFEATFGTAPKKTEKIFTSILHNGLNPASIKYMPADYNKNGVVTLNELYKYMAGKVKAEAKKLGYSQSIAVWPRSSDVSPVYARISK